METGVWGAVHNVHTNLKDLKDAELVASLKEQADSLAATATAKRDTVLDILQKRK